jgi:hypothetical protein
MKDGRRDTLEVIAVEGDTLVSATGARYARTEMAELHHEQIDQTKVAAIVGVSVGGWFVLVAIVGAIFD